MEFYDVIKKRRSIRKYKKEKIPDDVLKRILDAGRIAPSAKNIQPWKFIVIRDEKIKKKVAEACKNQIWMADADVIICGCADEKIAYGKMGGYMSSFSIDLAIAIDHIILAAANEGLGTCWIGAFDEKEVKNVLGIPDDIRVVALTPIGYPDEEGKDRGRKSFEDVFVFEKYK